MKDMIFEVNSLDIVTMGVLVSEMEQGIKKDKEVNHLLRCDVHFKPHIVLS